MATITGTAMGHNDFYATLLDFLQNNVDLVASSQEWTEAWTPPAGAPPETANQIVLRGPGLAGMDDIYIGLDLVVDVANLIYEIHIYGMADVIPTAETVQGHVNVSTRATMFLDPSPFTFWLVGNGRRFVSVARISTVFQTMYGGLIQQYAQPPSYPYPLFIGAMAGDDSSDAETWRSESEDHNIFLRSFLSTSSSNPTVSSGRLLDPAGAWRDCAAQTSGASETDTFNSVMVYPYEHGPEFDPVLNLPNSYENLQAQISAYGGDFAVLPTTLFSSQPQSQVYGIFDGIVTTQGLSNMSENLLDINGVDYLVVQNAFRTGADDFFALALE